MPVRSRSVRWLLAAIAALAVSACNTQDDSTVNVVVIGHQEDLDEDGVHLSLGGQLLRASTAEGLVAFDAEGRVIPALADRWIVTDDGRSYIFRLRDGSWKDGTPLTARTVRIALRKIIADLKGTALGLDLAGVDQIRAMAGRVIEIRLTQPMPHLLQLLAQPELGLSYKGESAGPMIMRREKRTVVLSPLDPETLGLPAVPKFEERARTVRLVAEPSDSAVERFNNGTADVLLGGSIEDFPLASSVGILRGTIQLDPVMGLFGLAVMNDDGFLETPENREALAMAIDRDGLIAAFGVGGWKPSTRIVANDLEGDLGTIGERWTALDLAQRRKLAADRVARWRTKAEDAPHLRIALPQGPGADKLFTRLQQDFAAVGIETERVGLMDQTDLRLADEVARYPLPSWFLNRFNCRVQKGLCNENADERMAESRSAADAASRAALLAEAEAELTAANVFIPFGAPIRWSLVRSDAIGFAPNGWGWHPLMPMALRPR